MNIRKIRHALPVFLGILVLSSLLSAQQAALSTSSSVAAVPRLVNFSGKAIDAQGRVIAGVAGITFAIYSEESGGSPLWIETQSVKTDAKGNYTAQLGATKADGIPLDLFSTSAPRWLGARINGGEEQPRVLLLSVPYALKAEDSATLGGLPASAFMLAGAPVSVAAAADSGAAPSAPPPATITGSGTADYIPLWTGSSALTNSVLYQIGSGSSAKIGINQTSPAATLDIGGGETVRGLLNLPAAATATAAAGADSRPFGLVASTYNSSTKAAANQVFHWQAEPAGNNTSSPSATLNLLFATAPNAAAETGLRINSKGQITFASGQTFPGAGSGTVTSVGLSAPSSDFSVSGSPVTGSGTLALNWNTAPSSSDTANSIVKRDSTGSFSIGLINAIALNVNNNNSGLNSGLAIIANATGDAAILGGSDTNSGVAGTSVSGDGVFGDSIKGNGVEGDAGTDLGYGVYGTNTADDGVGVYGYAPQEDGTGLFGQGAYGVLTSGTTYAGFFDGNVEVTGTISNDSGSFKIDDPLDPANKYLYHSFVESPDMMNIYNGNVTTDAQGDAVVALPEWFETLNRDFRYQLTVMGQFSQAIVSSKVANHQFSIKTDKPNVEVSWQVTGIRQDAWANAHRIPVEEMKSEKERGFYKHPELYNAPAEKSTMWARFPQVMKRMQAARTSKVASAAHNPMEKALPSTKP